MLTFLEINGSHVQASDRELADWIIAFSAGTSPHEVRGMTYPFQSTIATSDGDRAWVFRYSSEGKSRSLLLLTRHPHPQSAVPRPKDPA